jgi:predicted metal-dependent enzyme (double-stranded beta helix superfamily)
LLDSNLKPIELEFISDTRLTLKRIYSGGVIHRVEALGDEPTISFNLYGETNYEQRFEFDPVNCTAKTF